MTTETSNARGGLRAGVDRLWDSQWVNIVNSPEVLNAIRNRDYEVAVGVAIRMTEKKMAENFAAALSQQSEAQGGGEVAAWETEDGRVISARQKATALRDGGASASSVAPYTTPLYRTAPQSAPVGVEDVDALAQEIRRVDGEHSLGASALAEALVPYLARTTLAQQPAAVDEAYPTPRNRAEAVALARLALAHLGVIDAHIDAAIARCETNSAAQPGGVE